MKYLEKIIVIFFVMLIYAGFSPAEPAQGPADEKEIARTFTGAKKFVYSSDWQKAIPLFKKITGDFPENKWTDDSLYWLAYSMNRLSREISDLDRILALKEEAFKNLALLKRRYPSGKWAGSAKLLALELAGELVDKGLIKYKKYIANGVKENTASEVKLAALGALLYIDREKAFPVLEKIIRENKSPKMREKAIFVLGQLDDPRVVPLLVEVALTDTDGSIREKAISWMGHGRTMESLKQLVRLYKAVPGIKSKKKIIYSISLHGSDKAVKELLRIYREEKSLELKKTVIFWLGNCKSEEAQEFLLKILQQ